MRIYANERFPADRVQRFLEPSRTSRLADPVDPAFVREFHERTLARPVPPALVDTAVRESLKVPARVWRAAFEGSLEDDFIGELDRIAAPTLIMWGALDSLCRAPAEPLGGIFLRYATLAFESPG